MKSKTTWIDIVFDGPPSHESGRFVEVENEERHSINFGTWLQRSDGYWVLRIPNQEYQIEHLRQHNEMMRDGCIRRDYLIEQLDKAMASREQIQSDIKAVGGFVSGLNLTTTDEAIVKRAIKIIENVEYRRWRWRRLKRLFLRYLGAFLWQLSFNFYSKMEELRPAGGFKEL